ncbi:MAG: carboxylesterase, partial [Myxococcota bacterium]
IARENERGIHTGLITLAGFSKGGAMALYVGLRYPVSLQGIMVLSAYMLDAEGTPEAMSSANRETPVFFAHGRQDAVVPFDGGKRSHDLTVELNPSRTTQWREYQMGHEVCETEIADIGEWLRTLP